MGAFSFLGELSLEQFKNAEIFPNFHTRRKSGLRLVSGLCINANIASAVLPFLLSYSVMLIF